MTSNRFCYHPGTPDACVTSGIVSPDGRTASCTWTSCGVSTEGERTTTERKTVTSCKWRLQLVKFAATSVPRGSSIGALTVRKLMSDPVLVSPGSKGKAQNCWQWGPHSYFSSSLAAGGTVGKGVQVEKQSVSLIVATSSNSSHPILSTD